MPPVTFTVVIPSHNPAPVALLTVVAVAIIAAGSLIVTLTVVRHPLESSIVII